MVFDTTYTNVARGKRCYSNQGTYSGMGTCTVTNDNIVHSGTQTFEGTDSAAGGLYHASVTTAGTWVEYDLGGVYNLAKVVIFNRFLGQYQTGGNATGGCCSNRLTGANIIFRVRALWGPGLREARRNTMSAAPTTISRRHFSPAVFPRHSMAPQRTDSPPLTPPSPLPQNFYNDTIPASTVVLHGKVRRGCPL